MSEIASLVQKYLAPTAKSKRLNYYTLLSLDEGTDDATAIARAIEQATAKLKAADRTADPLGFEQVVKVFRQARATLLDLEKKRQYDAQLRAAVEKRGQVTRDSAPPVGVSNRLSSFLPPGDPDAPFSLSEYLKQPSETVLFETVDARRAALSEMTRSAAKTMASISPLAVEEGAGEDPIKETVLLNRPASTARPSVRELQERIRSNRRRKNLIAAAVAVGGSLVVVLVGAWMLLSNRMERQRRLANRANSPSLAGAFSTAELPTADAVVDESAPRSVDSKPRMNLGVSPQASPEKIGPLPKISDEVSLNVDNLPASSMNAPPMAEATPLPDGDVVPQMSEEPKAKPQMAEEPNVKPQMTEEPKGGNSTSNAPAGWRESMLAARKALVEKDFAKFEIEIDKALQLSGTDEQNAQYQRLDHFGQLYAKGIDLTKEALSALRATDEIRFGSAGGKAIVVEASPERLVIKDSGTNKRYPFDEIPLGLLMSILESKLTDSPMDQAIRGIMLTMSPRSNAANKTQAKELFEKAAAGDPKLVKLDIVLTEAYQ